MSHPLSGLLVHTCNINSDDVGGGVRIASIIPHSNVAMSHPMSGLLVHTWTINSDDVGEGGFRIATISKIVMT